MNKRSMIQGRALSFSDLKEKLQFDGERYVSGHLGPTQHAHHHRYLFAAPYCKGKDVLDVASGEGYGSDLLAQVANSVVGVDIDADIVAFAKRQYVRSGLRYINASATSMPFDDDSFDVVVSYETIEHLDGHKAFMDEICRVLRPGGLLIISSPNRPIYSDKPNYKNPFHVKELDLEEFRDLLVDRFASVHLLAQRQATGSVLSPEVPNDSQLEIYVTENGRSYRHERPFETPQYFVALASDEFIEQLPGSILTNEVFMPSLQKESAYRAREVAAERNKNRELSDNLQQAQQSLANLTAIVERLNNQPKKSFGVVLGAASKKVSYHVRYLLLAIRAFVANPLSRRQRRQYIERHLKRSSVGFVNFTRVQTTALEHIKWKFKAVRRYPTSSARRKKWRRDNPLLSNHELRPIVSSGLTKGSTLHSRLYENWVSNASPSTQRLTSLQSPEVSRL